VQNESHRFRPTVALPWDADPSRPANHLFPVDPSRQRSVADAVGAAAEDAQGTTAGSLARKHRRQNLALLVTASVLGLWLGTGAPEVSPVAPPGTAAVQSVAPAPTGDVSNPAGLAPGPATIPTDRGALNRLGRGRR
jgi:hypothetical protein